MWVYEDFGQRLRAARTQAGLTQEQVAKRVGLGRTSITNIEAGKQHIPLHFLWELAAAVGEAPERLFPAEPPPQTRATSGDLGRLPEEARAFAELVTRRASDREGDG